MLQLIPSRSEEVQEQVIDAAATRYARIEEVLSKEKAVLKAIERDAQVMKHIGS